MSNKIEAQRSDLRTSDGVLGVTSSIAPTLRGQGLVVVGTQIQAELSPCIEVALRSDGSTAGALALPVADILGESRRSNDGWLIHLGVLPDIVYGAITGDGADFLALSRASTVAGVLLDVVLDKGVRGPAVHRDKYGASLGLSRPAEVDLSEEMSAAGVFDRYSWTYRVVPVFHPLPTTKSPALEKETE